MVVDLIRVLALLLLTLLPKFALAQDRGAIFSETLSRCSQTHRDGGLKAIPRVIWKSFRFQTMGEGFGQTFQILSVDPAAIADVIQTRGLSPRLAMMLSSAEFNDALQECYGANELLKQTYRVGLILSDMSGKVAAGSVVVAAAYAFSRITGALVIAYPLARYGIFGLSMTAAVTQAISIRRELSRTATPEEEAAVRVAVTNPIQRGDEIVKETVLLLKSEIQRLNTDLPTASDSERAALRERVARLTGHLNKLQSYNENQTEKGNLK